MWCDMRSCHVIWCDMMSCDMMSCDVIWYDMIWCNVMWCDVMWCNLITCHAMPFDLISYDIVWCDMIWYDMIWYSVIWYDMIIWAHFFSVALHTGMISLVLKDREAIVTMSHVSVEPTQVSLYTASLHSMSQYILCYLTSLCFLISTLSSIPVVFLFVRISLYPPCSLNH